MCRIKLKITNYSTHKANLFAMFNKVVLYLIYIKLKLLYALVNSVMSSYLMFVLFYLYSYLYV